MIFRLASKHGSGYLLSFYSPKFGAVDPQSKQRRVCIGRKMNRCPDFVCKAGAFEQLRPSFSLNLLSSP